MYNLPNCINKSIHTTNPAAKASRASDAHQGTPSAGHKGRPWPYAQLRPWCGFSSARCSRVITAASATTRCCDRSAYLCRVTTLLWHEAGVILYSWICVAAMCMSSAMLSVPPASASCGWVMHVVGEQVLALAGRGRGSSETGAAVVGEGAGSLRLGKVWRSHGRLSQKF